MAQINQLSVTSGSVSLPNSGSVAIFSNIGDSGNLYLKASDGTVTPVGNTSGGGGSGSSGTSGTGGSGSGSSGTSGTGISGSSGTSGTGVSGSAGTSGTSGSGSSGTSGNTGSSGTSGNTGSSGTSGINGSSGTSGANGSSGTSGANGSSGTSGSSGSSGTSGSGSSGTSGNTGSSGTSGTSAPGISSGTSGSSGSSGTSGSGSSGTSGNTGSSGTSGVAGSSGTSGANGSSGTSGSGSSGTSGAAGGTGSSGTSGTGGGGGGGVSTVFASSNRYSFTSGLFETQIMSSGTVFGGLTWSRSTTTLTITSSGHGLTTGNQVLIRNMSSDYQYLTVTVTSVDTFTVTVADSGGTSGTAGAYIPCFKVTALNTANITLTSPSAGNCQLISINTYLEAPDTNPVVTVPADLSNGAGSNTSLKTKNIPIATAFKTSDGLPYSTFGYTFSTVGNFNQINTSGLDNEINCILKLVY